MKDIIALILQHDEWVRVTFIVFATLLGMLVATVLCYLVGVVEKRIASQNRHPIYHNEDGSLDEDTIGRC